MANARTGYSSDVSDAEWDFCAPYLTLMNEASPQRTYALRDIFNGLRWFVRAGCPWRMLPTICRRGRPYNNNTTLAARGLL